MGRRRGGPQELARRGDLVVLSDPERPGGRLLCQDDMEASYVDLEDPRHLEFDYLRRMRDLVVLTGARELVHVGGAACALARALAAGPGGRELRQLVVEADAGVLDLAREHLGLRRLPGLRVRVEDGRVALAGRPDASCDAVLVDAFVGARVPRHLVSVEAAAEVARVLRPGGVAAVNVVDGTALADVRAVAAALCEVFASVGAVGAGPVLRGRRAGNVVLLARSAPLPLDKLRVRAAADGISPGAVLDDGEVRALCAGVAPWTDRDLTA